MKENKFELSDDDLGGVIGGDYFSEAVEKIDNVNDSTISVDLNFLKNLSNEIENELVKKDSFSLRKPKKNTQKEQFNGDDKQKNDMYIEFDN